MKRALRLLFFLTVLGLLFPSVAFLSKQRTWAADDVITSRNATVDVVKLHYLLAGHG